MSGAPDVLLRIVEARRARFAEEGPPAEPAAAGERSEPLTAAENPFLAAVSGPVPESAEGASRRRGSSDDDPSDSRQVLRSAEGASRRRGSSNDDPSDSRQVLRSAEGASRRTGSAFGPTQDHAHRRAAVIAEVKMGSPRIGSLAGRVDPEAQARLYERHGAAALSVVVEPDFFGGSYDLLARCREACGLPAIAKDFVVDGRQLERAKAAGADAVLLLAALHSPADLARWARRARALGLVPLVETHGAEDVARLHAVEGAAWELVGVNNRDLRTFRVDLAHSIARLPELPPAAVKVAESGIGSGSDIARLAAAGFDAFLVGESLLLADDPAAQLADLVTMGLGGGDAGGEGGGAARQRSPQDAAGSSGGGGG